MSDLVPIFNLWVQKKIAEASYNVEVEFSYGHQRDCKLVEVVGEPVTGSWMGGYCETCEYATGGLEFKATCTCGKTATWRYETDVNILEFVKELLEMKEEIDADQSVSSD